MFYCYKPTITTIIFHIHNLPFWYGKINFLLWYCKPFLQGNAIFFSCTMWSLQFQYQSSMHIFELYQPSKGEESNLSTNERYLVKIWQVKTRAYILQMNWNGKLINHKIVLSWKVLSSNFNHSEEINDYKLILNITLPSLITTINLYCNHYMNRPMNRSWDCDLFAIILHARSHK